jgi:hypothetical protein
MLANRRPSFGMNIKVDMADVTKGCGVPAVAPINWQNLN